MLRRAIANYSQGLSACLGASKSQYQLRILPEINRKLPFLVILLRIIVRLLHNRAIYGKSFLESLARYCNIIAPKPLHLVYCFNRLNDYCGGKGEIGNFISPLGNIVAGGGVK